MLLHKFLSGEPVELTESSQEVIELREILEGNQIVEYECGKTFDLDGRVYWNDSRTIAVLVPPLV